MWALSSKPWPLTLKSKNLGKDPQVSHQFISTTDVATDLHTLQLAAFNRQSIQAYFDSISRAVKSGM